MTEVLFDPHGDHRGITIVLWLLILSPPILFWRLIKPR